MTYLLESELLQSQDTWKRSQIRLTPTLHKAIVDYSTENDLSSFNTALLVLINKGLTTSKKPTKRNVIFTEYNPSSIYDEPSPNNNEEVRMACADFMTQFFARNSSYEFIQFESNTITDKKGREIIVGIRIWYSYPA